eukprot:TRINITY_DN10753_c0_g2_i1.p2 TRINITY_DN10753_c0_g2~~TRINITY_DN10753_c0_g2_i1.p2  ORF type:complete len:118 (+),score=27.76 TRINITY_DN10753_c0_g2_i1:156-509(+)
MRSRTAEEDALEALIQLQKDNNSWINYHHQRKNQRKSQTGIMKIMMKMVVEDFKYDLLLGTPFLLNDNDNRLQNMLKKYVHTQNKWIRFNMTPRQRNYKALQNSYMDGTESKERWDT